MANYFNQTKSKPGWVLVVVLLMYSRTFSADYLAKTASEVWSLSSQLAPGDTITMAVGIWENQQIVFSGTGTSEAPLLLRAEIAGQVLLTGTSTLQLAGEYLVVDGLLFANGYSMQGDGVIEFEYGSNFANHSRLTNTVIVDYNPPSQATNYKWVSLYGHDNRVDHCYMAGKNHAGSTVVVWLEGGADNHHLIDNNYFGQRPDLGVNGAETIRVGTGAYSMVSSNTVIEYNLFEHCNGEAEIISNKSLNNIFRYNTFFESEGSLTLRNGNFGTAHNNYFIGNGKSGTGGIRVIGEDQLIYNNYFENLRGTGNQAALVLVNGDTIPEPDHKYDPVKRAKIYHNTFINCKETILIGGGSDNARVVAPEDCIIADNLVLSEIASEVIEFEEQPTNLIWQGNIMFGRGLVIGGGSIDGITWVDPGLEQDTFGLWQLSDTSIAIDASTGSYAFMTDDMHGQSRDGNFDVGADEYSDDAITHRPLTATDVGPYWWPVEFPVSAIKSDQELLPTTVALHQNYPNPFNPVTTVSFELPELAVITLNIYDLMGREVWQLAEGEFMAGEYRYTWDGRNNTGELVPSGIYFAKVTANDYTKSIKMLFLK
ncbi:chondroitinase-B domain-containing protein [Candidatus Neomarinimicrobiota bacterium]